MEGQIWIALIPFFPLLGFLILGLFQKKLSEFWISVIGCATPLASFLVACKAWELLLKDPTPLRAELYTWLSVGNLKLSLAFLLDPLALTLCLIVTGVGFLIHVYSIGYMHGDPGYGRYFSYLNLFTSMMLVLVLGENLPLLFVGWEGVGLCSYLLIGFWYKDMEKAEAAQKAFVVNRVGDAAFLLGTFLLFSLFGTLSISGINEAVATSSVAGWKIALACVLLFIGATGKSAQIPLYVWLPDAMAGPTPVSALIHAATMVTAGVYMIGRLHPLFSAAPWVGEIIAFVGALTALFAATMGLTQRDIKKVLAYSTISQLGYMFLAMGLGAYTLGVFHLTTHAFFKALLFLGAGSVIHAFVTKDYPHGIQDIFEMGGLWNRLPLTFAAFLVGGLSLAALPPFSGFYSKDPILAAALDRGGIYTVIWVIALLAAFCTTIYTFRLISLTFFGKPRGKVVFTKNPHPSKAMGFALLVLVLLSFLGGFGLEKPLEHFLSPVFGEMPHPSHRVHVLNLWLSVGIGFLLVVFTVYLFTYRFESLRRYLYNHPVSWFLYFLSYRKYFVDEIYHVLFVVPLKRGAKWLLKWVDFFVIEGIVNGIPQMIREIGYLLRLPQTGRVNQLTAFLVGSAVLLLVYVSYVMAFVWK